MGKLMAPTKGKVKKKKGGTIKELEKVFGIMSKKEVDKLRKAAKEFRRNFKPREYKK